ncbi:MAG: prepilin-type N-terminal cleavage/methylation domain-containing protein [Gemmatimonadales bacterium]|nr:prepilin-type N-terminal cleavage/methylation domain-containing protein [Gemmatimonadales bacterium]
MRPSSAGFTLLELLTAVILIAVGLTGLLGTLGAAATLAAEGKSRSRAALAMASRLDRLRAEAGAMAPACRAPAGGAVRKPDGTNESWNATLRGGLIDVLIVVARPGLRRAPDTLATTFPCP